MNGGVAASCPAGAVAKKSGMVNVTDVKVSDCTRLSHLGVTLDAEIHVTLQEHLCVDGTVRIVADGATLAQSGMLEYVRPRLLSMTGGAIFVQARNCQSTCGFHDVHAMRVVALDTIHFAFENRVMLRQMEFRARFLMALETGCGVVAGIDDEFFEASAAGHDNVLAPRAVAGFTAELAGHVGLFQTHPRVRTGGKHTGNVRMAIRAGFVPNVSSSLDLQRDNDRSIGRTGI